MVMLRATVKLVNEEPSVNVNVPVTAPVAPIVTVEATVASITPLVTEISPVPMVRVPPLNVNVPEFRVSPALGETAALFKVIPEEPSVTLLFNTMVANENVLGAAVVLTVVPLPLPKVTVPV